MCVVAPGSKSKEVDKGYVCGVDSQMFPKKARR